MNSYAINFFVGFHDFSLFSSLVQQLALPLGYGILFPLGKKGFFLYGHHVRELVVNTKDLFSDISFIIFVAFEYLKSFCSPGPYIISLYHITYI